MTNKEWLDYLAHNAPDELAAWFDAERITNQAEMLHMPESHGSANPDCSAMLYKTFTGNMCSNYEPKDGVVAILREAARNLSDYHDAGEALRRLTDTTNVYHALETLADMIERDYVRRESIEEVMDNDRALVEENSMLAGELLKLRAELEKATNNLNSANKDFENARAELTAELDAAKQQINLFDAPKSVETSENPASKCEISDFEDSRDKLEADIRQYANPEGNTGTLGACWERKMLEFIDRQAAITERETKLRELYKFEENHREHIRSLEETNRKLNERIAELTAERDNLKANNEQLHILAGEQAATIDELQKQVDELANAGRKMSTELANMQDYITKVRAEREHYREKCSKMATIIHDALMVMDEGMA